MSQADSCSDDDFQPSTNYKRSKHEERVNEDDVAKSNKTFTPKVNLVKSKNKMDLYRNGKKTMQKRVYDICKSNDISAAIILPSKLFSKEIEVSGSGFTLDEITVAQAGNFVPDFEVEEEMSFQEYRRKTYPEQVPAEIEDDVDNFLKQAVRKTLGMDCDTKNTSIEDRPENPVGDVDGVDADCGDRTTPERSQIIDAESVQKWLEILPSNLHLLHWNADYVKDPLYRFMDLEGYQAMKLLQDVRNDLQSFLIWIQDGEDSGDAVESIKKGKIPLGWIQYEVPEDLSVEKWIFDFIARVNQIQETIQVVGDGGPSVLRSLAIWIGGLLNPEKFIKATKECVSKLNYTPEDDLELHLNVGEKLPNKLGFDIKDLKLKGASFRNDRLFVTKETTDVSIVTLRWLKKKEDKSNLVTVPFYVNSSKETKLSDVLVPVSSTQNIKNIRDRGIEFVATHTFDM